MSNINKRKWALPRGLATRKSQEVIDTQKLFDFERAVKETLNTVNVPWASECESCPPSESVPVRYNTEDGIIEYLDDSDSTWNPTEVAPAETTGYSGDIVLDEGTLTVLNGLITDWVEAP